MKAQRFTLEEARETLPQVKAYMEDVQAARREILRLRPDTLPVIQRAAMNGGNKEMSGLTAQVMRLEAGVKGIMALGVVIKDVDAGLIDFVGTRNGREVYLCWRYGEEEIGYWHEINAGFAGRQPLDDYIQ
jgi:hypothetical protein